MPRILAPHKEQDGWVYVRVRKAKPGPNPQFCGLHVSNASLLPSRNPLNVCGTVASLTQVYADWKHHRIISSRRVEEAVETADYLKRCAEECLVAVYERWGWSVSCPINGVDYTYNWGPAGCSPTLREAYHRYKQANER